MKVCPPLKSARKHSQIEGVNSVRKGCISSRGLRTAHPKHDQAESYLRLLAVSAHEDQSSDSIYSIYIFQFHVSARKPMRE